MAALRRATATSVLATLPPGLTCVCGEWQRGMGPRSTLCICLSCRLLCRHHSSRQPLAASSVQCEGASSCLYHTHAHTHKLSCASADRQHDSTKRVHWTPRHRLQHTHAHTYRAAAAQLVQALDDFMPLLQRDHPAGALGKLALVEEGVCMRATEGVVQVCESVDVDWPGLWGGGSLFAAGVQVAGCQLNGRCRCQNLSALN